MFVAFTRKCILMDVHKQAEKLLLNRIWPRRSIRRTQFMAFLSVISFVVDNFLHSILFFSYTLCTLNTCICGKIRNSHSFGWPKSTKIVTNMHLCGRTAMGKESGKCLLDWIHTPTNTQFTFHLLFASNEFMLRVVANGWNEMKEKKNSKNFKMAPSYFILFSTRPIQVWHRVKKWLFICIFRLPYKCTHIHIFTFPYNGNSLRAVFFFERKKRKHEIK